MHRKFIFRGGSRELVLPVTPQSYKVEAGRNIELVNIHALGDAVVAGYGTLATVKIDCMLPASPYPFARGSNAERYLEQLRDWAEGAEKLRFVISGTGVNMPVLLQNVSWGEQDGTNDIYAALTLREYRTLKAVQVARTASGGGKPREPVTKTASAAAQTYTAKYGDTLCAICRKYYGDDSPATYQKLAAYNGKSNPNLLMVGETLKIPQPLP